MNPNQYYGSPANFMSMPNAPYYQPPIMSPRPTDPSPRQTNPVPQFSPPVLNQPNPVPQYSQPQYQYGNNQNMSYSAASPGVQNSTPYQPNQQNSSPNQTSVVPTPILQNYQYGQPSQMPFYQSQNVPSQNYNLSNPNQYADNANVQSMYNSAQPLQNAYSIPTTNPRNFYPQQVDPQQLSFSTTPNTSTNVPTTQAGDNSASKGPLQSKASAQEEVQKFKPTYVIGEYKCSDFPNLFTGPFRYSGSPVQRKPFTMKNDSMRYSSQSNADRRTHTGLARHAKRWELRGGKYYGCFTSRTNGLQDICPKAKCKLCPTDRKK